MHIDRILSSTFVGFRKLGLSLLLCVLFFGQLASAQNYRVGMAVNSVDIYEAMLKFAKAEEYSKITKSMPILKKIFAEEKSKFNVDIALEIERAIRSQDNTQLQLALLKAVFLDIKDIFWEVNRARGLTGKNVLVWIKIAIMDYRILEPFIDKKDKAASSKIRDCFKRLIPLETTYADEKIEVIREEIGIRNVTDRIESYILSVFPELE